MRYLIFASHAAAAQRSRAAYAAATPGSSSNAAITDALWGVAKHPDDGRAALAIPLTPEDAALGLSQAEYDALLSAEEWQRMVERLEEGWAAGVS